MPVSLSIKAVPDATVERLRQRAAANHRSLQRELMAIVEAAVQALPRAAERASEPPRAAQWLPATNEWLGVAESETLWRNPAVRVSDELLQELDHIVAGTHWGEAPLLTREQTHDRALAREIDFDARQVQHKAAVPGKGGPR